MTQYRPGLLAASDLALTPDSLRQWPSLLFPRKGPCSVSRFWFLPLSSANPKEAPGTSLVKVDLENQCSVLSPHRPGLSGAGPQCTLLSTFFPPETLGLFTSFISQSLWAFLKSQLWFLFDLICWHLFLYLNSSVRVIGGLRPVPLLQISPSSERAHRIPWLPIEYVFMSPAQMTFQAPSWQMQQQSTPHLLFDR